MTEGYTYKFDTSDSTNATHHMKFSTTADGTHGSGVDYTTGVTYNGTPGQAGAYTQIVVPASAPTLYYWCHHHASMGGQANTPAEAATTSMRYKIETKNQSYTAGSTAITDSSSSGHTITLNGNAKHDTAQSKFGTGSVNFDGTGDYLTIPDSTDWTFGSGDFTWDFWVRFNVVPTADTPFLTQWNKAFRAMYNGTTLQMQVEIGSETTVTTASWSASTATWYHLAFVRSGSSWYQFVDGTQSGSTGSLSGSITDLGSALHIGWQTSTSGALNGWIDELRISKGIARWTSNFTPPTSAYTTDSYTKLLMHMGSEDTGKVTRIHGTSLAWK